jgi:hypothetical protein
MCLRRNEFDVQLFPSRLKHFLADSSITKVGVSIHQDANSLRKFGIEVNRLFCLKEMAESLSLNKLSLADLSYSYCRFPLYKGGRAHHWNSDQVSERSAIYAAKDALAGLLVYRQMVKKPNQNVNIFSYSRWLIKSIPGRISKAATLLGLMKRTGSFFSRRKPYTSPIKDLIAQNQNLHAFKFAEPVSSEPAVTAVKKNYYAILKKEIARPVNMTEIEKIISLSSFLVLVHELSRKSKASIRRGKLRNMICKMFFHKLVTY